MTRGPIGYGDGLNVYLYVHNNPINFVDPLGLETYTTQEARIYGTDIQMPSGHAPYFHGTTPVEAVLAQTANVGSLAFNTIGLVNEKIDEAMGPGASEFLALYTMTNPQAIIAAEASAQATVERVAVRARAAAAELTPRMRAAMDAIQRKMQEVRQALDRSLQSKHGALDETPTEGVRGQYPELRQRAKGTGLQAHEMPSWAAVQKNFEMQFHRKMTPAEEKLYRSQMDAILMKQKTHVRTSTYGGKNIKQSEIDKLDLPAAKARDEKEAAELLNKNRKTGDD